MSDDKRPRTSLLAIASMVLGIMTVTFGPITGIFAILIGVIALVQIARNKRLLGGWEYAVTGLILCALIIPVRWHVNNVLQERRQSTCISNAKQLGYAVAVYTQDYDWRYPPKATWCDAIRVYLKGVGVYQCPSAPQQRCGYAWNRDMPDIPESNMSMLFDAVGDWNTVGGPEIAVKRHPKGMIYVFGDSAVKSGPRYPLPSDMGPPLPPTKRGGPSE